MTLNKNNDAATPSESEAADRQEETARSSCLKRRTAPDMQLLWRGKFDGDGNLTIKAPPLYIQEKINPAELLEELTVTENRPSMEEERLPCLFPPSIDSVPETGKADYYRHGNNWANRMILGDSLHVMASLAAREGLRGRIQAIYIDPPYGISFNSNFQWSTRKRDAKETLDNFTREPEQVKAFRDAWKDGIHSYLSYLRDRMLAARELLAESGSIFVQIGEENAHRARLLLDEIFGENNFVSQIDFKVTSGTTQEKSLKRINNYVLWYAKNRDMVKFNRLYIKNSASNDAISTIPLHSSGDGDKEDRWFQGRLWSIPNGHWRHTLEGFNRLAKANRIMKAKNVIRSITYAQDFPVQELTNVWTDTGPEQNKNYVVQTNTKVIERCLLMSTSPGDIVLDPTCGSGTTAFVAEQWGRRWITIDTSRVALAIARARIMGAHYPYYLLKENTAESGNAESSMQLCATHNHKDCMPIDFVYESVPHISLKSIASNAKIDEIWEKWQKALEPLREQINKLMRKNWEEWEVPPAAVEAWPERACKLHAILGKAYKVKMPDSKSRPLLDELNQILKSHYKKIEQLPARPETAWSAAALTLHGKWREAIAERQKEIDASIAENAAQEILYDQPRINKRKIRLAGPFTVESISPHRALHVGPDGETLDPQAAEENRESRNFIRMILDNLALSGIQQSSREDRINFTSLVPWPGERISAEGRWQEGESEKRAGILIGPEFGTVSQSDLLLAAKEAADSGFNCLVACGFNFDALASEMSRLGPVPILKARMNPDLQIGELKNDGKGNLFVIFGEPDIDILPVEKDGNSTGNYCIRLNGVDVYYPASGEICSNNAEDVACWMADTNYDGKCFRARQVYFPGQKNPYETLKATLKAEIDPDVWESLRGVVSRPFRPPKNGMVAVKAINHLGDEVMKIFRFPQE